jgi:hypothetical protein
MNQRNSSIFNFDHIWDSQLVRGVYLSTWILLGLVLIDVGINFVFAFPEDPKVVNPSALALYFEYGRSSEAKLARMTRVQRSEAAPILAAGWYDPLQVEEPKDGASQPPVVTFYGMSHAVRLAMALGRTSDRFLPRIVAAPGATANWAYGAYLRDRGGGKSRAVVLALMSANLPMITTMSPLTWNLDFALPYTADRFYLDDKLQSVHPPFESFEQYAKSFYDPKKWREFCDLLAKVDPMYDPLIMHATIADHSALLRLVRRAYGQRLVRNARKQALDQSGFEANSEQIEVARAIVQDFALQARSDGILPVIFLVNTLGYSDYLFQALRPILVAEKIPCLSSHTIVSPNDPRGYLPDSHFTDKIDEKLAEALVKLLANPETSDFCKDVNQ